MTSFSRREAKCLVSLSFHLTLEHSPALKGDLTWYVNPLYLV